MIPKEVQDSANSGARDKVLGNGDARLQIQYQVVPSRRNVQNFTRMTNALFAAWRSACFGMEAKQPLCNTQRTGDLALILADEDTRRRRNGRQQAALVSQPSMTLLLSRLLLRRRLRRIRCFRRASLAGLHRASEGENGDVRWGFLVYESYES